MSLKAPTPPTPPTIDKGDVQSSQPRIDAHQFFEVPQMPFHRDEEKDIKEDEIVEDAPKVDETPKVTRQETTPEDMARDAVAHGSGALTKKEITRPNNDSPKNTNPTPIVTAPNTPANSESYERGQAVLREFREEDDNNSALTVAPSNVHSQANVQSHGGIFWIVTLIFVVAATFIVAKKFLFRSKPKLKKSDIKADLFKNSSEKLKSATKKFSKPVEPPKPADKKIPPVKPARMPKKDDDDKGKHFEVRV